MIARFPGNDEAPFVDHRVSYNDQKARKAGFGYVVGDRSEKKNRQSRPKGREYRGHARSPSALEANGCAREGAGTGEGGKEGAYDVAHSLADEFAIEIKSLAGLGRDGSGDGCGFDEAEDGEGGGAYSKFARELEGRWNQ